MSCKIEDKKEDLATYSNGDFDKYNDYVKKRFFMDFVNNISIRNGRRISAGRTLEEIEECFNHLTSSGSMDDSVRLPDLRRYECLFMLKDILTNKDCDNCKSYLVWEKKEKYLKEKIFCVETGYLIILLKRERVYKFVSAYQINRESKKQKLIEEYNKFKK